MNRFFYHIVAFFIVFMLFARSSVLAVLPWMASAYYFMLCAFAILSLLFAIIKKSPYKLDLPLFGFLFVGLLSIISTDVDPQFQPVPRYIGFVMIAISFGSLYLSIPNVQLKLLIIKYFKTIGIGFTVISFIVQLLHIPLPIRTDNAFGLANHDMTMAPIAFISSIFVLDDWMLGNNKKIVNIILFLLCVACGVLTGSRGALGSFLIAMVIYLMLRNKGSKKLLYGGLFAIVFALIYINNPYGIFDHFLEKMDRDSDDITYMLSGRDVMIKDRIDDFRSSPIYGVGFSAMKNIGRSKVNFQTGIIESGSSWFLILGSTGLLGLFFYILSLLSSIRPAWKKSENIALIACVFFFMSHSMVEGYIISFGAPLCALFWLLLGMLKSHVEYNITVKNGKV